MTQQARNGTHVSEKAPFHQERREQTCRSYSTFLPFHFPNSKCQQSQNISINSVFQLQAPGIDCTSCRAKRKARQDQGTCGAATSVQMSNGQHFSLSCMGLQEYPVPQSYESPSTTTGPGMRRELFPAQSSFLESSARFAAELDDALQMKEQEALIRQVLALARVQQYASLCK